MIDEDVEIFLEHFGVKGMRWGVRNDRAGRRPERLSVKKSDTNITKQVKKDYNELSSLDFLKKYATTKRMYSRRVNKYGDPYRHRIDEINKKDTSTIVGELRDLHNDKILNKLYNKIADIGEKDPSFAKTTNLDIVAALMDKVFDRRVKIKEIDPKDWE